MNTDKWTRMHVIPIGDVEIHCAQSSCWCHPTELEPGLWAHHAKDCREARERVIGQCSPGWVNVGECPDDQLRDQLRADLKRVQALADNKTAYVDELRQELNRLREKISTTDKHR